MIPNRRSLPRVIRTAIPVVVSIASVLWGAGAALAGERLALVIGNSAYESVTPLNNSARDAQAIAARLAELGFELVGRDGENADSAVLELDELGFADVIDSFVSRLRRSEEGVEIALVYYAGHGMQFDGNAYLLPVDVPAAEKGRLGRVRQNSIRLDSILRDLEGRAELTVAVFDACREIPSLERSITRGVGAGRSDYRGLARPGRRYDAQIVAYSGAAGEMVEDGRGKNSPYTTALLEALAEPDAQVMDTLREARYLLRSRQSQGGQTPELIEDGVPPGRFSFFSGGEGADGAMRDRESERLAEAIVPVPDRRDLERTVWEAAQHGNTTEEYELYLGLYPEGAFAAFARARIERGQKKAEIERASVDAEQAQAADEARLVEEEARRAEQARGEKLLTKADAHIDAYRLTSPAGDNALEILDSLRASGAVDTDELATRYQRIRETYAEMMERRLDDGDLGGARRIVARVESSTLGPLAADDLNDLLDRKERELARGGNGSARPSTAGVAASRGGSGATSARYREPVMLRLPAGRFDMGSTELGRRAQPRHEVEVSSFEIGAYEVTFGEYRLFAQATGRDMPDEGQDTSDHRPVVGVSWHDATAYAEWLSERSGKAYTLPTEAQWEYAARAGNSSRYSFGSELASLCEHANGDTGRVGCDDGYAYTAPVGSYLPNAFGLHDMHGNVAEWVLDCWKSGYGGAPVEGHLYRSGDCYRAVVRGGAWRNDAKGLQSAYRDNAVRRYGRDYVGFRLIR